MKKTSIICVIMGIVCFALAGYIVYNKFFKEKDVVDFNKDNEIKLINDKLTETGSSLGWTIIVSGIDHQSDDGSKYNVSYDTNLLSDYSNRQLFVMEYILSTNRDNDKFIVLSGFDNSRVEESPTADFTLAYLDYNTFNDYYKKLFDEDFDLSKAQKGNTSYDKEYVYYSNRRAGSNGIYVSMITSNNVEYKDGKYIATVDITYSTRASELIGREKDTGSITYTKNIDNDILFGSFIVNK